MNVLGMLSGFSSEGRIRINKHFAVIALVLATSITLATAIWPTEPTQAATTPSQPTLRKKWSKKLSKPRPCADEKSAKCATLKVPRRYSKFNKQSGDYPKSNSKRLYLPVRWSTRASAKAPALLYFNGGPGLGDNKAFLKSALRSAATGGKAVPNFSDRHPWHGRVCSQPSEAATQSRCIRRRNSDLIKASTRLWKAHRKGPDVLHYGPDSQRPKPAS
jgi:hypothetical protein